MFKKFNPEKWLSNRRNAMWLAAYAHCLYEGREVELIGPNRRSPIHQGELYV